MHKIKLFSYWLLLFGVFAIGSGQVAAIEESDLLPPNQAFSISADGTQQDKIRVKWKIADGYYLYQSKIRFTTDSDAIVLEAPELPPGETKHDEFFGDIEIYRNEVIVEVPTTHQGDMPNIITLHAKSQGCADIGVCFPPQTQTLLVAMNDNADQPAPINPSQIEDLSSAGTGPDTETAAESVTDTTTETPASDNRDPLAAISAIGNELGFDEEDDGILPPDQAYRFSASIENDTLRLFWQIADGTYLYYDKVKLEIDGKQLEIGDYELPEPEIKSDSVRPDGSIGDTPVYHGDLIVNAPLINKAASNGSTQLTVSYQGCAERGICYPPIRKKLQLNFPASGNGNITLDETTPASASPPARTSDTIPAQPRTPEQESFSEEGQIANVIKNSSTLAIIGVFFLIGLGLAFTPCVFPMIPILSGIITGQGANMTTRKATYLSTVYVLAMAVTYTLAGVFAAMSGENLQILLQIPWVIALFAGIFVLLALSMFGFYELQLPSSLQSKLTEFSNRQSGGNTIGVAIMGFLSALIVGPCVAPPLAGALLYIGQTNDPVLGGLALFAMSMGMGMPLILIGASAGKLLPRAGGWMDTIKAVFGVSMLGLAIYFLERILPEVITLFLWASLLIISSVYMGALRQLPIEASGWQKLWKGMGLILLIYGALMLVGVAADSTDLRQPLRNLSSSGHSGDPMMTSPTRHFKRITTMAELDSELAMAKAAGRPAVLDFYADWCVYCKTLEKEIFPAPEAQAALSNAVLIQADVTDAGSDEAKALMKRFGVIAPPVIVFWNSAGQELKRHKIVGEVNLEEFVAKTRGALQ